MSFVSKKPTDLSNTKNHSFVILSLVMNGTSASIIWPKEDCHDVAFVTFMDRSLGSSHHSYHHLSLDKHMVGFWINEDSKQWLRDVWQRRGLSFVSKFFTSILSTDEEFNKWFFKLLCLQLTKNSWTTSSLEILDFWLLCRLKALDSALWATTFCSEVNGMSTQLVGSRCFHTWTTFM